MRRRLAHTTTQSPVPSDTVPVSHTPPVATGGEGEGGGGEGDGDETTGAAELQPAPQHVTKLSEPPEFSGNLSHCELVATILRVVHEGHDTQLLPVEATQLFVHDSPSVHVDSLHSIFTMKSSLLSPVPLNACFPMLSAVVVCSTIKTSRLVSLNACCPMVMQPEVRMPHMSGANE